MECDIDSDDSLCEYNDILDTEDDDNILGEEWEEESISKKSTSKSIQRILILKQNYLKKSVWFLIVVKANRTVYKAM